MDSLCRVRNNIMHLLSSRTISAPNRVLFYCLSPSLVSNSGNNHKNNSLGSAETVRHSSTYIILYVCLIDRLNTSNVSSFRLYIPWYPCTDTWHRYPYTSRTTCDSTHELLRQEVAIYHKRYWITIAVASVGVRIGASKPDVHFTLLTHFLRFKQNGSFIE